MSKVSWRNVGKLLAWNLGGLLILIAVGGWLADDSSLLFRQILIAVALFLAVVGIPAAAIILFLLRVWPTMWRYNQIGNTVARIRRFDGRTEVLTPSGWRRIAE